MLVDLISKFQDQAAVVLAEADKFSTKGNQAAGTRARLACQALKTTLTDIRKQITIDKELRANTKGE